MISQMSESEMFMTTNQRCANLVGKGKQDASNGHEFE